MNLLLIALAPVFIIAAYIYFRDKYEKEPLGLLVLSLFFGGLIVIPVVIIEKNTINFNPFTNNVFSAAYNAFVVAGFTEEFFKWLLLLILIWQNKNFNQYFDGVVYAVFVSLGFAAVENVFYVFDSGFSTGIFRAFTAVPLHAMCGVYMGFYFSMAKFNQHNRLVLIVKALIMPLLLHGLYDFFLMTAQAVYLLAWLPFFIWLIVRSFKKLTKLSKITAGQQENYDI